MTMDSENQILIRPFFRWVGGKQNIIREIIEHVPNDISQRSYFEPFLGAASLFLAIKPKVAFLADLNSELINAFKVVKNSPEQFYELLIKHQNNVAKQHYNAIRAAFNNKNANNEIQQAAHFVFLIQTSFNGIFRVNRRGEFNVPFGRPKPQFPSREQIERISKHLRIAKLRCQ